MPTKKLTKDSIINGVTRTEYYKQYYKKYCKRVCLNLDYRKDADIIEAIEKTGAGNFTQGVRVLIRQALNGFDIEQ